MKLSDDQHNYDNKCPADYDPHDEEKELSEIDAYFDDIENTDTIYPAINFSDYIKAVATGDCQNDETDKFWAMMTEISQSRNINENKKSLLDHVFLNSIKWSLAKK